MDEYVMCSRCLKNSSRRNTFHRRRAIAVCHRLLHLALRTRGRKADARPRRANATTRNPASTRLQSTSGADIASANPMRTVVRDICKRWVSPSSSLRNLVYDSPRSMARRRLLAGVRVLQVVRNRLPDNSVSIPVWVHIACAARVKPLPDGFLQCRERIHIWYFIIRHGLESLRSSRALAHQKLIDHVVHRNLGVMLEVLGKHHFLGWDHNHNKLDVILLTDLVHLLQEFKRNSHAFAHIQIVLIEPEKHGLRAKCFQNMLSRNID